ncbi:2-(1,2-epoxy-1,2-dihydrophenyl)acetyl-CoA isomerase [Rhizobiales bacterium GAS191]|nr:2-(1,2-epoxy-1,2-dihydrophenyl)acetyl-CoA isomerase [Rhizobiales bacterium GAS191]
MEETVLGRTKGGVGRLTLNRPDRRNAMSAEMMVLFQKKLQAMDADPAIRCIILDGAGDHFVAGGDIKAWSEVTALSPGERGDNFRQRLQGAFPLLEALEATTKPLIVAARGYCIGAGLCFVLTADFVVADETARIRLANINVGLNPDMGVTYWLPRVIGERRALRMALLGHEFDAMQARDLGLIDEVTAPGALEAAVEKLVRQILAMPARAAAETKRLIRLSRQATLASQFAAEVDGIARCVREADFLEAVSAFSERRAPRFGVRG